MLQNSEGCGCTDSGEEGWLIAGLSVSALGCGAVSCDLSMSDTRGSSFKGGVMVGSLLIFPYLSLVAMPCPVIRQRLLLTEREAHRILDAGPTGIRGTPGTLVMPPIILSPVDMV